MAVDLAITAVWTFLSAGTMAFALYGGYIASRESADTDQELERQSARLTPNGVLILALQQASQAEDLKWVHVCVMIHQTCFFLVGLLGLLHLLIDPQVPVDTPTTDLLPYEELFVPMLFLLAQFIIVVGQQLLIHASRGQRRARADLRALEMDDADALRQVVERINARLGTMEDRSQRIDRREARHEARDDAEKD